MLTTGALHRAGPLWDDNIRAGSSNDTRAIRQAPLPVAYARWRLAPRRAESEGVERWKGEARWVAWPAEAAHPPLESGAWSVCCLARLYEARLHTTPRCARCVTMWESMCAAHYATSGIGREHYGCCALSPPCHTFRRHHIVLSASHRGWSTRTPLLAARADTVDRRR